MNKNLIANSRTSILSKKGKVWEALVTPSMIKEYMFGANVESDWREGSGITWKGDFNGKQYEDKGVILKIDPGHILQYSHFSPLSGKPDKTENYHIITIVLDENANKTEVILSQDNNSDEKARGESEKNWKTMLEGLKKYVEKLSRISDRPFAKADGP